MSEPDRPDQVDAFGRRVTQSEVTPPKQLQLARWLWIASTAVGIGRSMLQLGDRQLLVTELRKGAPALPQDQVDAAVNSAVLLMLLFSAAIGVLYVLLSNRMVQGRRWARIVMTVLCSVSVVGTAFTLVGVASMGMTQTSELAQVPVDGWDLLFSAVILVLDVGALVLMHHPESNRYFQSVPRRTRAQRANGAG